MSTSIKEVMSQGSWGSI